MNLLEGPHPVFVASQECKPGSEICQPLEIQLKANSRNLHSGVYSKALSAGKHRSIDDFQILNLLKKTQPILIYNGYDQKRKEPVSLLKYIKVDEKDISRLFREAGILRTLKHKNMLEFYGVVYGDAADVMHLTFEPFECFLSQLLCQEHQQIFEPPVVKCVMLQLFNGLVYLHEKEIVHRDLSTKNVVLTENGLLKISNFRNARRLGQCNDELLTLEYCYQPAEVLLGCKTISTSIDIWSASCIFAELLLKQKLFKSPLPVGVLKEIFALLGQPSARIWPGLIELPYYNAMDIKDCSKFNCISTVFKEKQLELLLRKCLYYDPIRRISAEECLQEPYFLEEPSACSIKSFGMKLHGQKFKFPVLYTPAKTGM